MNQATDELLQRAGALRARYELSGREEQILVLVVLGAELKSVGAEIGCAYSSVRTHLRRMAHKMGCSTTREIVIRFFSDG